VEEEQDDFIDEASEAATKAVTEWKGDLDDLREKLRLAVRRVATNWTGKKPIVDVLIVETA
jgi:ribonuclease J